MNLAQRGGVVGDVLEHFVEQGSVEVRVRKRNLSDVALTNEGPRFGVRCGGGGLLRQVLDADGVDPELAPEELT